MRGGGRGAETYRGPGQQPKTLVNTPPPPSSPPPPPSSPPPPPPPPPPSPPKTTPLTKGGDMAMLKASLGVGRGEGESQVRFDLKGCANVVIRVVHSWFQQNASAGRARVRCTCCHTEIEVANQTRCLYQSQYNDTGPVLQH